ncbi:MAG: nitrile hydratase subunit beta [Rhizobiaceae bacterium]
MNGAADLGGMMGFGPVDPEQDEPVFHSNWERRAFALTLAMGFTGSWNLDQSRFARESMPPAEYLGSSYYQIWLVGLEKLMLERGLVTGSELESGIAEESPLVTRILAAEKVSAALARGGPVNRDPTSSACFSAGDAVVARNMHPVGHTRLPRYLRGRRGSIRAIRGAHVFPDSNAAGNGEDPKWLYSVEFSARELWGEDANESDTIVADCWEPYLDPA